MEGMMMVTEIIGNVVISLDALEDDASIEGNCSAIDEETDAQTAAHIRAALEAGNEWAWCIAQVTAELSGDGAEGTAYLGGCSYASAESFKTDGYYADMVLEALEQLRDAVAAENRSAVEDAIAVVNAR
jgi:hypothetical protein